MPSESISDGIAKTLCEMARQTAEESQSGSLTDVEESLIDSVLIATEGENNSVHLGFKEPVSVCAEESQTTVYEVNQTTILPSGDMLTLVSAEITETVDENGKRVTNIQNNFDVKPAESPVIPVNGRIKGRRCWTSEEGDLFLERFKRLESGICIDDLPSLDEEQKALYDIFCECYEDYRLEHPYTSASEGYGLIH